MLNKYVRRLTCSIVLSGVCLLVSGCTPQEHAEAELALNAAVSSLLQNRTLVEQTVRDVKATGRLSDPAYLTALDSYQNAHEVYNRFLDGVEKGDTRPHTRSIRLGTARDVQNATADFLADAMAVTLPTVNTRHIPFQRSIVIPDNLPLAMKRLPKNVREQMLDQLDPQVRWRSWSEL